MAKEEKSLNERLAGLSPGQLKAMLHKGRDESTPRIGKPPKMERNSEGIYPLSKAQERMWFLHNLSEGEAIYNNPVALRISAVFPLNIDILIKSLEILTERHEILRTTFFVKEGKPVQQVHLSGKTGIRYEDLRHLPLNEREIRAMEEALQHGKTAIQLDKLPLLRFKVLHLRDLEYILLINPHHIISDGWSNALFAKELSMTYAALESKEPSPFHVPEYQYIDFVNWEKEWMGSPACKEQLEFWKGQLADLPEPLRLPLDFPRPAIMSHIGRKEVNSIHATETEKIRQFCKHENLTLFQMLFGAFGLLMSKYSGQQEIMIGVPVARRNQLSFQQTMGLFINTLPLRVKVNEKETAIAFLKQIKTYCQQAFMRQELPFEKLIEEVNPDRSLSTNPVFQVHFVHQNIPSLYSVKGLSVKPENIDYSFSKFDLNFWVEEANQELIISVTFPSDLFLQQTIQKLLVNYKILLTSLISHPEEQCSRLVYFPENEGSQRTGSTIVYSEPGTTLPATWLGEFKAQVRLTPGNMAVRDIHHQITYRDLEISSDHLANLLAKHGVVKRNLVGLLLPRNASLIISILGIFKAGAAYVPLDMNIPEERMNFIVGDSGLKLIISTEELSPAAAKTGIPVLLFSGMMTAQEGIGHMKEADSSGSFPGQELPGPDDLAYVIYTSGTTGTPKGVCIASNQLLNYSKAIWQRINMKAGDSFATISSITADLGNTMIFPPLIHGGEVVIIPENHTTDASLLADWVGHWPVDCLKIVPSHLVSLLHSSRAENILPMKLLMLGGEKCTPEIVRRVRDIAPALRIINHYGPTEATIGALTLEIPFDITGGNFVIPIGFPLNNTSVYILDQNRRLLPKGIPGEIVLSGKNIAKGYLNQPQLSSEKFADDPFRAGERIYCTGDLGKMNEDGAVVFLGRSDHQVKIRGYRVESREIEYVLNSFPSIEQAAVLVPENVSSVNSVHAVIRLKQGIAYDENALRTWLSLHLPAYMIPSALHIVERFPLTSNGKTDLKELHRMIGNIGDVKKLPAPPRDLTELRLVNIFREILKQEEVGICDGFFDLGGHSLLAIQLFAAIELEFHIHLALATLFERGSVVLLADLIRKSIGMEQPTSLVSIRPGSGKKQVYLVHPAGGNVLCYFELARELGKEYSVYGLQATGLYGKKVDTVGDMACFYLEEISLPDCKDDVIFAGWSMGALIAFEMARQVGERSGENPRLMIIDQLAPFEESGGRENKQIDPVDRMLIFAGKVAHLTGRSLVISADNLRGKTSEEQSEVFLNEFKSVNLVPSDMRITDFHGYLELMIHHNEITSACSPGSFDGKTLLIRAMDALLPHDGQSEISVRTADLDWGRWIKKNLEIANIPGNHVSIIAQPCVKEIALALMQWVNPGL
ncbi:MAG: amino acid adenylation domain-containing protein [Bacteroidetes bacterium]|nr:amino acid adenylation domain-containing protein [Bacteroidota bacterium]